MSKKLWSAFAVGALLVLAGCSAGALCTEDADCAPADKCDVEVGACVAVVPSCNPMCAPYEECLPGNVCEMRYARVMVTSPDSSTIVGPNGVLVKLSLEVTPGRQRNDPQVMTLEVDSASGTGTQFSLARVGSGDYQGWWKPTEAGRTELVGVLGSAVLKSEPLVVEVEFDGPVFALKVPDPPARIDGGPTSGYDPEPGFENAWRRDEKVRLWVVSDAEDVAGDRVSLTVRGTDGSGSVGQVEWKTVEQVITGCDASYCGEVEVDLYEPELLAFRGEFELLVYGLDVRGNAGRGAGSVRVTRWKWQWRSSTGGVEGTPAIGPDGTAYVGTADSDGAFVALSPEGEVRWSRELGSVVASPIYGERDGGAFVAAGYYDGTRAHLIAMQVADGGTVQVCQGGINSWSEAAPALGFTTSLNEPLLPTVVSHENGADTLRVLRIGSSVPCTQLSVGTRLGHQSNLLQSGSNLFVPTVSGISSWAFSAENARYELRPNWDSDAGADAVALASDGDRLLGLYKPLAEGEFIRRITFHSPSVSDSYATAFSSGGLSVSADFRVFMSGRTGELNALNVRVGAVKSSAGSGGAGTTPLRGNDGVLYVARRDGHLEAWSDKLELLWSSRSWAVREAPLAIDCSRDSGGEKQVGRPAVLYSGSSIPAGLHAFIIDSRGLDVSAPWPKHQRDPWNTGNTETNMSQFACE